MRGGKGRTRKAKTNGGIRMRRTGLLAQIQPGDNGKPIDRETLDEVANLAAVLGADVTGAVMVPHLKQTFAPVEVDVQKHLGRAGVAVTISMGGQAVAVLTLADNAAWVLGQQLTHASEAR